MIRFNEKNEIVDEEKYQVILVGASKGEDISYSMEELSGLSQAAAANVLAMMIQNIARVNTATYIGKGKVEELAEMCKNMEADMVIFNDELSGMQLRNLEEALEVRVIDRTILILDIFAARASTREGKLQVELAQLQYRMPRLLGFGRSLSRLGGGIGTRGPGEKKLETDRRHIAKRMDDIREELSQVKKNRATQRSKREKNNIPVVALVGYTNGGKSALMNVFLNKTFKEENKQVESKDILFATLDTQQRHIATEKHNKFILVDTVGFVSKLPHSLVQAFKATLEEVNYADLLIHVVDKTYSDHDFHIEVTNKVLADIGAGDKEKIMVYNKVDLLPDTEIGQLKDHHLKDTRDAINISAKTGEGVDRLIEMIEEKIFASKIKVNLLIPYSKGDLVSYVCKQGQLINMEHLENGTKVEAEIPKEAYGPLSGYIIQK